MQNIVGAFLQLRPVPRTGGPAHHGCASSWRGVSYVPIVVSHQFAVDPWSASLMPTFPSPKLCSLSKSRGRAYRLPWPMSQF